MLFLVILGALYFLQSNLFGLKEGFFYLVVLAWRRVNFGDPWMQVNLALKSMFNNKGTALRMSLMARYLIFMC